MNTRITADQWERGEQHGKIRGSPSAPERSRIRASGVFEHSPVLAAFAGRAACRKISACK
jgi:hypothetical protein